jgi:sec-independent protein translocase protein TatA
VKITKPYPNQGEPMNLHSFGLPELLIILAIVVLLFGVGRIGKIAGELGKGIRSFRDGLKTNEEDKDDKKDDVEKKSNETTEEKK